MPGAMFFFLIPGISLIVLPNTWQNYLVGLFLVNIVLVILHLLIYRRISNLSPFIFLAIILSAGPIILYRHDLFVSLFLIISLLLWQSKKYLLSPFFLGIATSIKIFPVLLLPYFLIHQLRFHEWQKIPTTIASYLLGITSIFTLYILTGSDVKEIISTLAYNSAKPVHVESLWGSILTVVNAIIDGMWPQGLGDRGVFGINPKDIFLPLNFYNYFWLLPIFLLYLKIYNNIKKKQLLFEYVFLIVLLFTIFSKILTPQYLLWFATLYPLLTFTRISKRLYVGLLSIILIVMLLTQFIYPLHYNELLGIFYTSGQQVEYFIILFLRNLLLATLFFLIYKTAFSYTNQKDD